MSCPLSKRALKYISSNISTFVERGEIVTNHDVDAETYEHALKEIKKMCKKLPSKPEKYLDFDYFTPEKIDEIESAAEEWELQSNSSRRF